MIKPLSHSFILYLRSTQPDIEENKNQHPVTTPEIRQPSTSHSTSGLDSLILTDRPSCSFGSSCYRKNPQHKVEEAHPGDNDYKVK